MEPRRNVELKALDPDPDATLRAALDHGAEDQGLLRQRDTYFATRDGRLKLREEAREGQAPQAWLIAYARADEAQARLSSYHLVDVPDPAALRAALEATHGITVVVDKRRRLLLHDGVRIHLDDVDTLGTFVELEAVAEPGSDLAAEHLKVAELRRVLDMPDERVLSLGYAALLMEDGRTDALVAGARRAFDRAYVPYSNFPVGAAFRDEHGNIHIGANVENAAYPVGNCAEASAMGALIAGGGHTILEVAVMADTDLITPCGGCRQRIAELAAPDTPVHLCGPEGVRRTTTVGDLLPFSFGADDLGEARA